MQLMLENCWRRGGGIALAKRTRRSHIFCRVNHMEPRILLPIPQSRSLLGSVGGEVGLRRARGDLFLDEDRYQNRCKTIGRLEIQEKGNATVGWPNGDGGVRGSSSRPQREHCEIEGAENGSRCGGRLGCPRKCERRPRQEECTFGKKQEMNDAAMRPVAERGLIASGVVALAPISLLRALVCPCARTANSDGRQKVPARGARLRTGKTGYHLEQGLNGV
jgi:hypothetical protein